MEGNALKKEAHWCWIGKHTQEGVPTSRNSKNGSRGSGRSQTLILSTKMSLQGDFTLASVEHLRILLAEDQYLCLFLSLRIL